MKKATSFFGGNNLCVGTLYGWRHSRNCPAICRYIFINVKTKFSISYFLKCSIMKSLKLNTLLLTGFFLIIAASCKKTELVAASESKQSAAAIENALATANAASTAAQIYKDKTIIDLSDPQWREYNACTGELINIIKGIWHIDLHYMTNGNRFTLIDRSNVSGYKLINLTTGVEYTGSYISNTNFTGDITGEYPIQLTEKTKILLTTPGNNNNGSYFADFHITINANGELTAFVDNFRGGCQ
jgi:hypothetical protein